MSDYGRCAVHGVELLSGGCLVCAVESHDDPEEHRMTDQAPETRDTLITDEMVERACLAFYAPQTPTGWVAPPTLVRNMRAALEAALCRPAKQGGGRA